MIKVYGLKISNHSAMISLPLWKKRLNMNGKKPFLFQCPE